MALSITLTYTATIAINDIAITTENYLSKFSFYPQNTKPF